ncbi:serine/threonine protein phosphatase [Canna indica]|uniref:Serine/threonine protein phosphatase n=1 Tax=Canna indica TaxID=4628 RepID=A0AAQ3L5B8_9LILI|nr:serine/threonine protein phosphatase [Canna indica]
MFVFKFDYLKSLEIEEKINKIRWCHTANSALLLLSTYDKTIKYRKKISEMNVHAAEGVRNGSNASSSTTTPRGYLPNSGCSEKVYNQLSNELSFPPGGFPSLRLPLVVTSQETNLVARCRRTYAHAHDYHINSISNNRFEKREVPGSRSFSTEIITSISDQDVI